jgi:hypothetical protein
MQGFHGCGYGNNGFSYSVFGKKGNKASKYVLSPISGRRVGH